MKATTKDIANAINDLSKSYSKEELANVIASYLISERRTNELDKIMREVASLIESVDGVVELDVTSAFPVNKDIKNDIKKLLGLKKVIINESIDESLIGGVRVETQEKLLDLTLRSRLNKFKTRSN